MEENTLGILGNIISNYQSLEKKDRSNELLKYIKIEGIGFCISEKFKERFGCDFEKSLKNYYSALDNALEKFRKSEQNL